MNWVAGTLPWALGEQGSAPAAEQVASGSGKTRPSAWYSASLVATGVAAAGVAGSRHASTMPQAIAVFFMKSP